MLIWRSNWSRKKLISTGAPEESAAGRGVGRPGSRLPELPGMGGLLVFGIVQVSEGPKPGDLTGPLQR